MPNHDAELTLKISGEGSDVTSPLPFCAQDVRHQAQMRVIPSQPHTQVRMSCTESRVYFISVIFSLNKHGQISQYRICGVQDCWRENLTSLFLKNSVGKPSDLNLLDLTLAPELGMEMHAPMLSLDVASR